MNQCIIKGEKVYGIMLSKRNMKSQCDILFIEIAIIFEVMLNVMTTGIKIKSCLNLIVFYFNKFSSYSFMLPTYKNIFLFSELCKHQMTVIFNVIVVMTIEHEISFFYVV